MNRILALLLVLAAAGSAAAAGNPTWIVAVPFDFYVGNERMAAGEYTITTCYQHVLMVSNVDRTRNVMLQVNSIRAPQDLARPLLTFNKYTEDRIFLAKVADPLFTGFELRKSRREHESITSRMVAAAKPVELTIQARLLPAR